MDVIKTGRFIAALRTERGLNQTQFGELFGVTNKTVSRWETGVYMPPVEVLEMMSRELGVTVNEIISGERLEPEKFQKAAEENLRAAFENSAFSVREREKYFSERWERSNIFLRIIVLLLTAAGIIGGIYIKSALILVASAVLGNAAWLILYNVKRSYVERKAFLEPKK